VERGPHAEPPTDGRRPTAGRLHVGCADDGHGPTGPAAPAPTNPPTKSKRQPKQQRGRATRLVMLEPRARRGITVQLGGDVVLGRDPACQIMIDDDAYISQRHVRFYDYDGQPMVEDLGSTNGTFHNGSKLTGTRLLHPGDRVQAGTTVIEAQ
jgi:pSer/pThr/pTyr-binding forkhead associated (FHA) protein